MDATGERDSAPAAPRAQGLALGAAGLACAVPFLNPLHGLPIPTFYEEWLAFVLGLAAVLAAVVGAGAARMPRVALWLVAFVLLLALQWALARSAYRETIELGLLYVLWAALLAWLGAALRERCGAARTASVLASFILVGAALNAVLACVQAITGGSGLGPLFAAPAGGRVFGAIGQANLAANYLALGLASLVYLLATGGLRVAVAAALGLLLAAALALTGSRTAWLFVAWLVACGMIGRRTGGGPARVALRGALALGVALLVLQFALQAFGGVGAADASASALARMAGELAQGAQPVGGIGARLFLWGVALDAFTAAPLLGAGLGEFAWAYFNAHPPELHPALGAYQRQAHNLALQLLVETGLVGAALVVGGLAGWLLRAVRRQAAEWQPARWLALAGVGIALAHSAVEFPLWHAQFLGVSALLLGLGEPAVARLRSALAARWLPGLAAIAGLALAAGALWWHEQLGRWVYALPDDALSAPGVAERQRAVLRRASGTLLRPYAELPLAAALVPERARLPAQRDLNERMLRFAPIGPVVYQQVTLLALAGERERAGALLERALVLHPRLRDEYAEAIAALAAAEPAALGWVSARLGRAKERP